MPTRRLVFAGLVALAAVGLLAGGVRTWRAARELVATPAMRRDFAAEDTLTNHLFASIVRIPAGSARYAEMVEGTDRFQRKFARFAPVTLLHVVPGCLFMVLAPLQLLPRLRNRHRTLHRWTGRVVLLSAIPITASAFFFAWLYPHAGRIETLLITAAGAFFFYSGARAFAAIRRRDVAHHRRWMLRFVAGGIGISMVRVVSFPIALLNPTLDIETAFLISIAVGWTLCYGFAEWWIRAGQPAHVQEPEVVASPV